MPPNSQTPIIARSECACPATIEGTLKIPAPNIVPTIKEIMSIVDNERLGCWSTEVELIF